VKDGVEKRAEAHANTLSQTTVRKSGKMVSKNASKPITFAQKAVE